MSYFHYAIKYISIKWFAAHYDSLTWQGLKGGDVT